MYYYNENKKTISNNRGFIVYRANTEREFRKAIKRYKAVKLNY